MNPTKKTTQVYGESVEAFKRRDFEQAIVHADELVMLTNGTTEAVGWGVRLRLEAGRFHEAAELGQKALEKESHALLSSLVGHAYVELADHAKAEAFFEQAIAGQPTNAPWLVARANALMELGRDFEAMECLRKAMKFSPSFDGLVRLAELELFFGNPAKALKASEQAAKMHRDDTTPSILSARSLMALNRDEEADAKWDEVLNEADGAVRIKLMRGAAEALRGEFEKADKVLKEVLSVEPENPVASFAILDSKKVTESDRDLIAAAESLLTKDNLVADDRISLEYVIGKSYDTLRDYETAMRHFDEANRLSAIESPTAAMFDRLGYAGYTDSKIEGFDRTSVELMAKNGSPSELPIFVLGMIRSGTTLMEQILSRHPLVSGAGEQQLWIDPEFQFSASVGSHPNEENFRRRADVFLRLLTSFQHGAERVVDKQPGNFTIAPAIHIAFPNARIIHMKRNPADTAVSIWTTRMKTSLPYAHDKSNIVFGYRQYERLMNHWRDVIPQDRFLEVQYEDVVHDRQSEIGRVLEFCGLPWSDECLAHEQSRKLVSTPSVWQARQPIYTSSIARWKNYEPWLGPLRELVEQPDLAPNT